MQIALVVALLFALLVAVFAVQNAGSVQVNLLMWQLSTSVAVVVVGGAAFGAFCAGLLGIARNVRLRLRVRQLQGQLERMRTAAEREGQSPPQAALQNAPAEVAPAPSTIAPAPEPGEVRAEDDA